MNGTRALKCEFEYGTLAQLLIIELAITAQKGNKYARKLCVDNKEDSVTIVHNCALSPQ